MNTGSSSGTRKDPAGAEPKDPHAHWAVPALERLQQLGPHGAAADDSLVAFEIPHSSMPPMPENSNDAVAMRKWLEHCSVLRSMFGSGR